MGFLPYFAAVMFIIGKFITIFLNPLLWIILLLLYAWGAKNPRRKKRAFISAVGMLLFFTNPLIINKIIVAYQPAKINLSADQAFSAGILLGGFSGLNEADEETYFNEAADRFIQAAELYKTGHIKTIVMTGGNASVFKDKSFKEADFAKEQLVNLSIPETAVWAERESRNTVENAINTKHILDSLQLAPPYLLITSAIHMPRAQQTFLKQGVAVTAFPCAFGPRPMNSWWPDDILVPSTGALRDWSTFLKELVGLFTYKLSGKA